MLVYIIGGLIGVFYFKSKYNLSTWQSISFGMILALGLYFGFGFFASLFVVFMGGEELSDVFPNLCISSVITAICFWVIRSLDKRNQSKISHGTDSDIKQTNEIDNSGNLRKRIYFPGDEVETKIVGVTFEDRQELVKDLFEGQKVKIKREPDNIHDTHAISVLVSDEYYYAEDNVTDNDKILSIIEAVQREQYLPRTQFCLDYGEYDNNYVEYLEEWELNEREIGYVNRELAEELSQIFDNLDVEFGFGEITCVYSTKNEPPIYGAEVKFKLPGRHLKVLDYSDIIY